MVNVLSFVARRSVRAIARCISRSYGKRSLALRYPVPDGLIDHPPEIVFGDALQLFLPVVEHLVPRLDIALLPLQVAHAVAHEPFVVARELLQALLLAVERFLFLPPLCL